MFVYECTAATYHRFISRKAVQFLLWRIIHFPSGATISISFRHLDFVVQKIFSRLCLSSNSRCPDLCHGWIIRLRQKCRVDILKAMMIVSTNIHALFGRLFIFSRPTALPFVSFVASGPYRVISLSLPPSDHGSVQSDRHRRCKSGKPGHHRHCLPEFT